MSDAEPKPKLKDTKGFKVLKRFAIVSVIVLVVLQLSYSLFSTKYDFIWVKGNSMLPTYQNNDIILLEKHKELRKDELVVFKLPEPWEEIYKGRSWHKFVKRIAAIPGDKLSWDGTSWSINDVPFSYVKEGTCQVDPVERVLKDGEIFVVGDTQEGATLDSREAFCKGLDEYLVTTDDIVRKGMPIKVFRR